MGSCTGLIFEREALWQGSRNNYSSFPRNWKVSKSQGTSNHRSDNWTLSTLWTCGLCGPMDSVDLWTLWTCGLCGVCGLCGPVDSVDLWTCGLCGLCYLRERTYFLILFGLLPFETMSVIPPFGNDLGKLCIETEVINSSVMTYTVLRYLQKQRITW